MARFEFLPAPKPNLVSAQDWHSWHWQMRNSTKNSNFVFKFACTPYYASLLREGENDPIRRILMPSPQEFSAGAQSLHDPLGEKRHNPVPRIIHRYSDRALFLVTDICSVYCRYCTRKHFTGKEQALATEEEYALALDYLKFKTNIREIILSGGDPLTISDEVLLRILHDIRKISHVEIIRIGTRMPVVNPMRVTDELVREVRKYKPVYLMTHFNHPRELTGEAARALESFVDHGIPVFNQMVLLNGVNNHAAIVQALSRRLLFLRAKPYYMFQCDPSEGTDHLRTSIEESESIQKELWGHLSGLAMPNLSLDIPDGGGKAALVPNFEIAREKDARTYRGWDGVQADYINPPISNHMMPADFSEYLEEWNAIKGDGLPKSAPDEHTSLRTF